MTKVELITEVASSAGLTKTEAKNALETIVELIRNEIKADRKISIDGLGIFKLKESKERQGINPATRQKITIAARKSAKFTPAKSLKDFLK